MSTPHGRDGVCLFLLFAAVLSGPVVVLAQCPCTGSTCPQTTAQVAPGSAVFATQPTPCTGSSFMVFTSFQVQTQFSLPFRVETRAVPSNAVLPGGSTSTQTTCFEKAPGDLGDDVSQSLSVVLYCDASNTIPCTFSYGITAACRSDPCRTAPDPNICVDCTQLANCGWCDRGGRSGGECISLNGAVPAQGTCTVGVDATVWSHDDIFDCPLPGITVSTPNAMTTWRQGDTVQIQYDNTYHVAEMDLELYLSGSSTRLRYVCDSTTQDCTNTGSFSWTIPLSVPVGMYHIRAQDHAVTGNSGQLYFGTSLAFQIIAPLAGSSSTGMGMSGASSHHPSYMLMVGLFLYLFLCCI